LSNSGCQAASSAGVSRRVTVLPFDGNRRPVKDLVTPGRFLLIAGEDGQAWCEAARQLAAEAGIPLDALRIGHLDGDLYGPRCTWLWMPAMEMRISLVSDIVSIDISNQC
jgi:hypothetical protein